MPVISVRDLTKVYALGDVKVRALRGVSIDIEAGEFVSVTGPSGSGKSTFMHILGCLDHPTSGQYFLDGADVSKLSRNELAEVRNKKIGFVTSTARQAAARDRRRRVSGSLWKLPHQRRRQRAAQTGLRRYRVVRWPQKRRPVMGHCVLRQRFRRLVEHLAVGDGRRKGLSEERLEQRAPRNPVHRG